MRETVTTQVLDGTTAMPIADIFDSYDQTHGGSFLHTHAVVTDPQEIERLLDFLDSAPIILATSFKDTDFLQERPNELVPNVIHSDGQWTWSSAVSYYLQNYGLAPASEFYSYIRSVNYQPAAASADQLDAALDELRRSP